MKNLYAYRTPNRWTNVLTVILSITFMIAWLPFIRSAFDGESYVWGMQYFGTWITGAGVTASFSFLVVQIVFYAVLIIGLYRMQNRLLYNAFLVTWWLHVFGNLLFDIAVNGDTMFHGDTMNVHISISMIVIPLAALAMLVVVQVIRSGGKAEMSKIDWSPLNSRLLFVFLGTTLLLLPLLATGEPHGTTDEIGVVIAIAQCFFVPFIFKPYRSKAQVVPLAS